MSVFAYAHVSCFLVCVFISFFFIFDNDYNQWYFCVCFESMLAHARARFYQYFAAIRIDFCIIFQYFSIENDSFSPFYAIMLMGGVVVQPRRDETQAQLSSSTWSNQSQTCTQSTDAHFGKKGSPTFESYFFFHHQVSYCFIIFLPNKPTAFGLTQSRKIIIVSPSTCKRYARKENENMWLQG